MKIHFATIFLLSSLVPRSGAQEASSPNGLISVTLKFQQGTLSYSVNHQGRTFLEASPLGLETSIGSFSNGLKADGSKAAKIDERYILPHGKVRDVHYEANEMTSRFTNANGDALDVIFRVSDRDVAFAYRISSRDKQRIVVLGERTGFDFPATATAFVSPQVPGGGGFAGSKPSYEEGYLMDVPVGTKATPGLGFTFPALFRIGSDGWMLVSETGVTSDYVGSRLANPTPDGLYTIAFPDQSENSGVGETTASTTLPLLTPWRTITMGQTLAPIVETTVATDVVKPAYEPSREYKPGRLTWSWLLWQDPSMNEKDQRTFIDLAATMGYEYILIDALWDKNIGREKMAELVAYARSKNVGVHLWYNSNGSWNDAPQSPRNRMHTAPARQDEMAWLEKTGVVGMKVDFFGGDKQTTMKLYEDILTDANRYGLMLNFHGATLPRGWERIYPNHMTSEAVTASENLVFSRHFAEKEAFNSTVFPFVRNPVAAMDYGPMVLNKRFSRDANRGNPRVTTDAFQLATTVTFQSPLQHFGLTPNNLQEQPDFVIDFLKRVPAVWDDTRFIDGHPGKLFAVARRSGGKWYLAVTNGEDTQKEWSVSSPLLKDQEFTVIHDQPGGSAGTRKVTVGSDGKFTLNLGPNGGAVLFQ